jgi:Leucine-rich repeat (LRR) protein
MLHYSSNQLTSLPEGLALLPQLYYIDARNNPLTYIPAALRQKEGLELLVDE